MHLEEALIVTFNYGLKNLTHLHNLEDKLIKVIDSKKLGEYDGHAIAADLSEGELYIYCPNVELLFEALKPILTQTDFIKGGKAKLRFGYEKGTKQIEIDL